MVTPDLSKNVEGLLLSLFDSSALMSTDFCSCSDSLLLELESSFDEPFANLLVAVYFFLPAFCF